MNDIICGDALTILRTLPDGCARCCVTSPPYFNLRDYGVQGQIGLEPTMGEYIARLVEVFIEVKRVLASDGTLWLNMADSYAGSGKGWSLHPTAPEKNSKQRTNIGSYRIEAITKNKKELPEKNLMGIPWRVAFALQDSGWILRQDIIWSKSNCMPESVRDRCTKSLPHLPRNRTLAGVSGRLVALKVGDGGTLMVVTIAVRLQSTATSVVFGLCLRRGAQINIITQRFLTIWRRPASWRLLPRVI